MTSEFSVDETDFDSFSKIHEKFLSEKEVKKSINDSHRIHEEKLEKIRRKHQVRFTSSKTLAAYATFRLQKSDTDLNWPLEMLKILDYLNNKYERKALVKELTIAMLELCLKKAPIQVSCVNEDGTEINMDEPGFIDFECSAMDSAIEVLLDLIDRGIVQEDELRVPQYILEERRKK